MPGIVGLITTMPAAAAVTQLGDMLATLIHEPFYRAGTWWDSAMGVYLAWTSRSESPLGSTPVTDTAGNPLLVFSGEEFSHDDMLEAASHPSFPSNLNGWFHGVLLNRSGRTAVLFNDRYGMHRMYYHQSDHAHYFAAEAKAILAVRPELRCLDYESLGEFVSCGAVLNDRSLFRGINLLPPGSAWKFTNAVLREKRRYFSPTEWEQQETLDLEPFHQQLREVFANRLPSYFRPGEQIAMSLTGGLDTRMIMAWYRADPGDLPCYTFGGMLRECKDVTIAREVARVCNQPHQVIQVGEDFLSRFPHYAERAVYLTDGCVDVSRAPDLYLNERARVIAPIRMTGNYGGEVLRSVRAFKPEESTAGLFPRELFGQAKRTYDDLLRCHPVSFAVFKQCPWHHYGILALEETQLSLRSPFLDNDLIRTLYRAPLSAFKSAALSWRLIGDGSPNLLNIPTDRGLSRDGMGISGTLSHYLLQFLFKAEYAYDMGMPQWLARVDHRLARLPLERLFLGRHKIFHFRKWYKESLARYLSELLLERRALQRDYVDAGALRKLLSSHTRGDGNYTNEIHKVLTLELLCRQFIDAPLSGNRHIYATTFVS